MIKSGGGAIKEKLKKNFVSLKKFQQITKRAIILKEICQFSTERRIIEILLSLSLSMTAFLLVFQSDIVNNG